MGFGFGFILGLSGELKKKSPVPGLHPRIKQVHLRLRTTVLDLKGKKNKTKRKNPHKKQNKNKGKSQIKESHMRNKLLTLEYVINLHQRGVNYSSPFSFLSLFLFHFLHCEEAYIIFRIMNT